jgi:predicted transport protein
MSWTCTNCNKIFRNTNQWHSCERYSIEDHLSNKSTTIRQLFNQLVEIIESFGPVEVNAVKTSVHFRAGSNFLGVVVKKENLELEFQLPYCVDEFPIHKTIQISGKRTLHYLKVGSMEELDEQLLVWLNDAYNLVRNIDK